MSCPSLGFPFHAPLPSHSCLTDAWLHRKARRLRTTRWNITCCLPTSLTQSVLSTSPHLSLSSHPLLSSLSIGNRGNTSCSIYTLPLLALLSHHPLLMPLLLLLLMSPYLPLSSPLLPLVPSRLSWRVMTSRDMSLSSFLPNGHSRHSSLAPVLHCSPFHLFIFVSHLAPLCLVSSLLLAKHSISVTLLTQSHLVTNRKKGCCADLNENKMESIESSPHRSEAARAVTSAVYQFTS
jgi:hypothetical protein